jgi:hypothetical protein
MVYTLHCKYTIYKYILYISYIEVCTVYSQYDVRLYHHTCYAARKLFKESLFRISWHELGWKNEFKFNIYEFYIQLSFFISFIFIQKGINNPREGKTTNVYSIFFWHHSWQGTINLSPYPTYFLYTLTVNVNQSIHSITLFKIDIYLDIFICILFVDFRLS